MVSRLLAKIRIFFNKGKLNIEIIKHDQIMHILSVKFIINGVIEDRVVNLKTLVCRSFNTGKIKYDELTTQKMNNSIIIKQDKSSLYSAFEFIFSAKLLYLFSEPCDVNIKTRNGLKSNTKLRSGEYPILPAIEITSNNLKKVLIGSDYPTILTDLFNVLDDKSELLSCTKIFGFITNKGDFINLSEADQYKLKNEGTGPLTTKEIFSGRTLSTLY